MIKNAAMGLKTRSLENKGTSPLRNHKLELEKILILDLSK